MRRSEARGFILRTTRLQPVAFVPELRLHLADRIGTIWGASNGRRDIDQEALPFWAFAWAGGLALARYLLDHPDEVVGRRVVDFGTGSGLCALAAIRAGARSAVAADIDPLARAAVALNAAANGLHVRVTARDLLLHEPPDTDLVIAGDTWYEAPLADGARRWLGEAHRRGARVLIGDPGRAYLPTSGLAVLAEYDVPTTREIEDADRKHAAVYELVGHQTAVGGVQQVPTR